jgi:hypothetical protein
MRVAKQRLLTCLSELTRITNRKCHLIPQQMRRATLKQKRKPLVKQSTSCTKSLPCSYVLTRNPFGRRRKETSPPSRTLLECFPILSIAFMRLHPESSSINNVSQQNTDLDRQSLSYCVSLIENGVNPEALAVSASDQHRPIVHLIHC